MKRSIILGTALAMALSVAPAMAGTLDMVKSGNGTALTTAELASVEGKMRRSRGGIRVGNSSYVKQKNSCYKCYGVKQRNKKYTSQNTSVKFVYVNVKVRFGGHRVR